MRRKLLSLLLALVMVLSLAVPAFAAEAASAEDVVEDDITTATEPVAEAEPTAVDEPQPTTTPADPGTTPAEPKTMEEALIAALRSTGLKDTQLSVAKFGTEQFAYDCTELAKSMGILPKNYVAEAACTAADVAAFVEAVKPVKDALAADKMAPLFMNGMAQPIFEYSAPYKIDGEMTYDTVEWKNENGTWIQVPTTATTDKRVGLPNTADTAIIRYCVYVETNYDTDGDGKLDLVKALVQLPRAAMEGDYQAATIYEARPYITGCTSDSTPFAKDGSYDGRLLYSQPDARVQAGTKTTAEAAAAADPSDWVYWNPQEESWVYEDLEWYDYYLTRGFAVVECGGLGTKGSEGFETCGTDLEIDAFKCVIEWLHGDRVAYTDKTSNIAIEADWSNGKVGMTGRSYAGTTQFGLSTTGVEGLETIVPVAGIASWYEYTNSQGVYLRRSPAYSDNLAFYCAGRYLDEKDYATISEKYSNYLTQIYNDQIDLNGDYSNENNATHWASRNYMEDPLMETQQGWSGIKIPALIVHGLNDTNVTTKQSDLMYDKFTEAGQNVKLLLHQNGHLTPTYPAQAYEIKIGDDYYDDILNRWFSHYLYDVNNGAEDMAAVTVQDNVDGSWKTYDSWEAANTATATLTGPNTVVTDKEAATFTFPVSEDMTVKGVIELHMRAKSVGNDFENKDGVKISVSLKDTNETPFNAYRLSGSYLPKTVIRKDGAWMGGGVKNYDLVEYDQSSVKSLRIGEGYIDVFNPEAGYDSKSAAKRETQIEQDTYYDYTVYILPNLYTVKAGHTMEMTVSLPSNCGISMAIDPAETYLTIPTHNEVADIVGAVVTNQTAGGSSSGTAVVTKPPVEQTATATEKFVDVETSDWYSDAVDYVVDKGLMAGVSDSSFGPAVETTRGMIVTILYRLENEPTAGTADFNDVADGQYYAKAVAWAAANNIVAGYGDGTFGPNNAITREQLVAILYRYAQLKGYDLSKKANLSAFLDAPQVSAYATDAMSWANAMGLVSGVSSTQLAPTNSAVRAQVAAILMNFCENVK